MIGTDPAVKAQFDALAATVNGEWRGLGHARARAELLGQVLGLAELVAEEARAQERARLVALFRAMGGDRLLSVPSVLAAIEAEPDAR